MKGWIIINNRLKLYDTSIELYINKKTKDKLRKIAYKQKVTMSEYVRHLIDFAVTYNYLNDLKIKKELSTKNVDKIISLLGGTFND